jgi:Ca2+-binding EF-hand superfamily protein
MNFEYEKAFEFRDEEIKEAFNTIDIHKNGFLTSEELSLFLDILGIKANDKEIKEMIRMADPNLMGKVSYEEFREMAKGQLLSPIGLAQPPTLHLLEGRIKKQN